jgi:RHS repeat-associated protein
MTTDYLGSPRVITDKNGNVISRRDFMPFGEELNAGVGGRSESQKYSSYGSDNVRKRFTGYEKDEETQLDFAEARMYQNKHGRFTAVDPLMASANPMNPQTFNRYVYTGNNPINYTDPSGLKWCLSNKNTNGNTYWSGDGVACDDGDEDLDETQRTVLSETFTDKDGSKGDQIFLKADGTIEMVLAAADANKVAQEQGVQVTYTNDELITIDAQDIGEFTIGIACGFVSSNTMGLYPGSAPSPNDSNASLIGQGVGTIIAFGVGKAVNGATITVGVLGAPESGGASLTAVPVGAIYDTYVTAGSVLNAGRLIVAAVQSANSNSSSSGNNTNPFNGPVDKDVTVVDDKGNAIPVKKGEKIEGSPDGKFMQVKDKNGNPNGIRKDGGGHPKHKDPKSQGPHGHNVDKNGDPIKINGNPHLPIKK